MSNLHIWKTDGKKLAHEYVECNRNKEDINYKRMLEIQNQIGVLHA